jgi:arsenate reductase (thioredoxin)
MPETLLFLCPHGAAKSIMAAAYCRQLVAQHGLDLDVTSAGTEPDAAVAPAVVELLRTEGLDVAHDRPRAVSRAELAAAFRVISMGCDVGDLAPPGTIVEQWNDLPSPSQDLIAARDVIYAHVERLISELKGLHR